MKTKSRKVCFVLALLIGMASGWGSAKTHKVLKGENFFRISQKYNVSVDSLMSFNGYTDPSKLQAGKTIKIPGKDVKVATRAVFVRPVAKPKATPKPVKKSMRIVVDAGHGGRDPGAIRGNVTEASLNLQVALRLKKSLEREGYSVTMTRVSDVFLSLERRAQIANRYRNVIFVSIHFNATDYHSVRGVETFCLSKKGHYLAKSIQTHLVTNTKTKNRGAKFRGLGVLRHTNCPAVLVECGFISNSYERSRCRTAAYQDAVVRAIIAGIKRYDRAY